MKFSTPDAAVWATVATRQRCESIQAVDPVAQEGTRFAASCVKCGCKPFRIRHDRDGFPFALCQHCGRERSREEVFIPRGSGGGISDPGRTLARLADLELCVDRAAQDIGTRFSAYCAVVVLPEPMRELVAICSARGWGPGPNGEFTTQSLRTAVDAGRRALAYQLAIAGMLETDLRVWSRSTNGKRHA